MISSLLKKLDTQSLTLFKNSSWVFTANLIGAVIAFLKSILIARGLGAEFYGIFTIIVVFISTTQETMNLNLGAAVIRFGSAFKTSGEPSKIVALLKLCLMASTLVTLASVTVISLIATFSHETVVKTQGLNWFIILYAIAASSIFFNQISGGALRLYFKFKVNSIVQIIIDIVDFSIIAIALIIKPGNFQYFLIAVLIAKFINSLIPNIAAYRELLPGFKDYLSTSFRAISDQFKPIRKFVFQNSISKTLQMLIKNGDILIIAYLTKDPLQVAYYTVSKKLAYSILTISDPLVSSIYPQLCDLYSEKKFSEIRNMILKLSSMALIPALLFILVTFFFNESIMQIVYGKEYMPSGEIFFLLSVASLISAVLFWIQPLLQAINLMVIRIKIFVAGIATGLISSYLLIPELGSKGMAISMIIINVVMPGLFIYFALKKLKDEENIQAVQSRMH